MLFRPEVFEPLTDTPREEARVRQEIRAIGDLGVALYVADCLEARGTYPIFESPHAG